MHDTSSFEIDAFPRYAIVRFEDALPKSLAIEIDRGQTASDSIKNCSTQTMPHLRLYRSNFTHANQFMRGDRRWRKLRYVGKSVGTALPCLRHDSSNDTIESSNDKLPSLGSGGAKMIRWQK
ncbi:hypothetical protein V1282_003328 [Nitrobacteraceae bacterium AZCC 2146]